MEMYTLGSRPARLSQGLEAIFTGHDEIGLLHTDVIYCSLQMSKLAKDEAANQH